MLFLKIQMVLETFYFCLFYLADIKKKNVFWFWVWNIQCGSSGNGSHMLYQNYGKQKQLRDSFFLKYVHVWGGENTYCMCTYGKELIRLSTWLIILSQESAAWQNGKIMEKINWRKHDFCPIKFVFKITVPVLGKI